MWHSDFWLCAVACHYEPREEPAFRHPVAASSSRHLAFSNVAAGLQSLCDNSCFSSGHGFSRAVSDARSTRLQPLRASLLTSHTDSSAQLASAASDPKALSFSAVVGASLSVYPEPRRARLGRRPHSFLTLYYVAAATVYTELRSVAGDFFHFKNH
jgi:hypothetical protein